MNMQTGQNPLKKSLEIGKKLNVLAPQSVSMIKSNINFALENTYEKSIERETYSQRFLGNSFDYQEGLKAFFEKRTPNFNGN